MIASYGRMCNHTNNHTVYMLVCVRACVRACVHVPAIWSPSVMD